MEKIKVRNLLYEVVKNVDGCFQAEEFLEKVTDYFDQYDYIFGDYSYGKMRLKGFNDKTNKNFRVINDIDKLDLYVENFCSYGAKYFLLKKISKKN